MVGEQVVESVAHLQQLAGEVAATLTGGEALLLSGELGAGKTTFVAALAAALGVTEPVTSPSFTIATEYAVPQAQIQRLVHIDLYRLPPAAAAQDPAVRDVLASAADPAQVTVIEWAERLGARVELPARVRRLAFAHGATPAQRIVTIA